jgi:hypothetical protein
MKRTVHNPEAQLAYQAVATTLCLSFDIQQLRDMSELTHDIHDVMAVAVAMRVAVGALDAKPGQIARDALAKMVASEGLRVLRERSSKRATGT